ncbi:uncharacterized protein [Venturia canescens]|uniref:uncharacterized protein n=1 Tax=Venturia canescens TaxID=32260 RepID=UPI001C9C483B|nr:uncharacterized protein LOC122406531 [Venturia canescens]
MNYENILVARFVNRQSESRRARQKRRISSFVSFSYNSYAPTTDSRHSSHRPTKMRLLLLTAVLSTTFSTGECFQFLGVEVPQVVDPRLEKVTLRCEYNLGNEQLYSVKWYKDKDEFYTFMPSTSPPGREYDVKGVKVDIGQSDSKRVVLLGQSRSPHKKINFAGLYGCEVSMEAPSYSTAFDSKVMSVAVLPYQDPALEGLRLRTHYDVGDVLTVNCTSAPSFPQAKLGFLLNHKEVSKSRTKELPSVGPIDENLVSSARLGLTLKLEREHFPGGNLSLICRSEMPNVPGAEARRTEAILTLAASNQRLAQEPPKSGKSTTTSVSLISTLFILASNLLCPVIFNAL